MLHLGGAKMLGYDFNGLPEEAQSEDEWFHYLSVVGVTLEYRSFTEDLPLSYAAITDDGGEVTFWVDTARERNGEALCCCLSL